MGKAILAVDIGSGSLKLLYGTKKKVIAYQMLDTPKDAIEDNRIVKLDIIYNLINSFLRNYKLRARFISFSIYGNDVVIRHIEVPYMKEADVQQTVEWEIGRNLPNAGANYYIDYEILNRAEGKKNKIYQILAVAVLKDRIENYLQLAKQLNLEIKAIDISANCTARVFKKLTVGKNAMKNVGIIDIGQCNTGITIIEKGKLAMERHIPFGFDRIMEEVIKVNPEMVNSDSTTKAFDYIQNKYNYDNNQSDIDIGINRLLDNVLISFQKVIQFYITGKIEKEISQIFVIGVGSSINRIEEIIQNYLTGSRVNAEDTSMLGQKVKLIKESDMKYFINTLGLLLRED